MMPAEQPSPLAEAAHRYAKLGIALIPLIERGKRPAFVTGKNHERAANDTERVDRWWHNDPDRNIGAACTSNRWCVIDIDGPEGWNTLASLEGDYGELPQTWTQVTGREDGAGQHFIFAWPSNVDSVPTKQLGPGLETRSHGAQIVLAPSIHPSGRTYQWQTAPWEMEIATLPQWVADLCEKPTRPDSAPVAPIRPLDPNTSEDLAYKRLQGLAEAVAHAPEGSRNHHLNHAAYTAGRLVEHGVRPDDIQTRLTDAGRIAGLDESEIRNTIRSGLNAGIADGPDPEHGLETISHPVSLPAKVDPETGEIIEDEMIAGVMPLNLAEVLSGNFKDEQWLIEPLLPKARQVALYAQGKTGKSLVALEAACALASGRPVLSEPAREPVHVVYIDFEMTPGDLQERLHSLDYTVDSDDYQKLQEHLHYYMLQPFSPMDTREGGDQVMQIVEHHNAELVVIDTLIRSVEGEENSSDTVKNFNRYTGQRIKSLGKTLLRVDHAGKDSARGQRGTSAKRDDVDLVWRLKLDAIVEGVQTMRLINDASRMAWVPGSVHIKRHDEPLRHTVQREMLGDSESIAWKWLQDIKHDPMVSQNDTWNAVKDRDDRPDGVVKRDVEAAQRYRKASVGGLG